MSNDEWTTGDSTFVIWASFVIEFSTFVIPIVPPYSRGASGIHAIFGTTNGRRYCRESMALAALSPGKVSLAGSKATVRPRR